MAEISYLPVLSDAERMAAVHLLRQGLVTVAELANALGMSRQAIQQLANKHGVTDVPKIRAAHVRKLWQEACKP